MTENKQIRTNWGVAKLYDTNIHYVIPKIRKRSQFQKDYYGGNFDEY